MTKTHSRAHIRLENQTDVLNFISTMSKFVDSYRPTESQIFKVA